MYFFFSNTRTRSMHSTNPLPYSMMNIHRPTR